MRHDRTPEEARTPERADATSTPQSPTSSRAIRAQSRWRLALALALLGTATVAWWRASAFLPSVRENQTAKLSLPQLESQLRSHENDPVHLYYLGKSLLDSGRLDDALAILERGVGLDPDSSRLRRAWTDAMMATGRVTDAFSRLQEFAKTHPESADAHAMLGQFYGSQNSIDRAREELDRAIALDPNHSEAWTTLAKVRLASFNTGGARDAAVRAIQADGSNADAHAFLAQLDRTANPASAKEHLEAAVRLAPQTPAFQTELARVYLDEGRLDDAARHVGVALKREPRNGDAIGIDGQIALARNEIPRAIERLLLAQTVAPGEPTRARLLADAYRKAGNASEAARWQARYDRGQRDTEDARKLRDYLVKNPDDRAAHRKLADLLARQGMGESALRHYSRATGSALDSPVALALAANALAAADFGEQALSLARLAVRNADNSPNALEARGNALLAMGRIREASVDFSRIADLFPKRVAGYRKKLTDAVAKRQSDNSPAARKIRQAQQLQDQEIGPRRTTDDALKLIEDAIALEPTNTEYLSRRFDMLLARQERVRALQAGAQLLTISPEDTRTHARVALLMAESDEGELNVPEVEAHLEAAADDPLVQPTIRYVYGLIALRKQEWASAVTELRQAIAMDPSSDVALLRLAQAERGAGNTKEAQAATKEYETRRRAKQEEADILMRIAEHPERRQGYADAEIFYKNSGRAREASVLRTEILRRFGK